MLFGRLTGWLLIGLAVIMASADAVLALGPAEYAGIVTADVVTLIAGRTPEIGGVAILGAIERTMLDMPAWTMVGLAGLTLAVACRKRHRRHSFRRPR